jgi:outer membrane protein assembly factor BamB
VSDNFGSSVTKLRASDGKVLGKFTVGHQPYWMAFDGGSIWIANGGDGTVTKLRASDGKNLGTFNTGGSVAVAFDGRYVWVTTYHQSVVRLNQDGSSAGTFQVGRNPVGVAFDGVDIWVANSNDNTVTKLKARDGTTLATYDTPGSPYGIAFDGTNIWITLPDQAALVKMRASDGTILYTPGVIGPATGIAFDGANIWTGNGIGSTTASKL